VNYDIGALSRITLAPGATAAFTVNPKADLQIGEYDETIIIGGTDGASATVSVSFTVTVPVPELADIPELWVEEGGNDFDIKDDGAGNFFVTFYGDTAVFTISGVEYIINNVPIGLTPVLEIEKDGLIATMDIYETAPDLYLGNSEVTFTHGEKAVFKLYVDGSLVGTFTVTYVNETLMSEIPVQQNLTAGSYWFAPVDLLGPGYNYEITDRPDTIGGIAPFVDVNGQFNFGRQVMPVSISREGEYVIRVTDSGGNFVEMYRITVSGQ
jgi:hypothetical protein